MKNKILNFEEMVKVEGGRIDSNMVTDSSCVNVRIKNFKIKIHFRSASGDDSSKVYSGDWSPIKIDTVFSTMMSNLDIIAC